MTVIELKNYLEGLCYDGKSQYMVRFADDPFETPLMYVAPFSVGVSGNEFVTLTNRDASHRDPRLSLKAKAA